MLNLYFEKLVETEINFFKNLLGTNNDFYV